MDHGHRRTIGGRDHVDFRVDLGKRLFQHDHGKNTRACADIAGARGHTVRGGHAGACVAFGWAERHAGLQNAGGVQQLRALGGQRARVLTCGQNGGQQTGKVYRIAPLCRQRVEFFQHGSVIPAGGAVNREHTAGVAHAQHLAPGQLPVYIPGQRREEIQLRQVRLAVQHGLVQVRYAPPLGDVEPERRGQRFRRLAGHRVAPGAERHEQIARRVKRQIAVHHGRNADAAHRGQRLAVPGLHIGGQGGVGGLHTTPDFVQRVGPDTVFQPILPGKVTLSDRLAGIVHQHRFNAGGAELNAEGTIS